MVVSFKRTCAVLAYLMFYDNVPANFTIREVETTTPDERTSLIYSQRPSLAGGPV